MAAFILDDPQYLKTLQERAHAGTLPPQVETMLYYYYYGKPVERHEVTGSITVGVADRTRDANDRIMRLRRVLPAADPDHLAS